MRLLCIAAESSRPGYVLVAGRKPTTTELARIIGGTPDEIDGLLGELERNAVFSRDRSGVIYCRRMIRETKKRDASAKGGKIGGRVTHATKKGIFRTQDPTQGGTQGVTQAPEARSQKPDSSVLRTAAGAADGKSRNGKPPSSEPLDDKTWLFRDGLIWLAKTTGRAETGLRSQLGRWLRDAGEDAAALRSVFEAARNQDVAEPIAWITAAIAARRRAAAQFEPGDDGDWRNRFRSFQANGSWPAKWGGAHPGDDPRHPAHILAEFGFRIGAPA